MTKRIAAITFIFGCTAVAWFILAATMFRRAYSSDDELRERVVSAWGAPQNQASPAASFTRLVPRTTETLEDGRKIIRRTQEEQTVFLPLESSRVEAAFDHQHRQKGLLWYSTYKVAFAGAYFFRNTSRRQESITFHLPLPATQAIYDELTFSLDGAPLATANQGDAVSATVLLAPNQAVQLQVGYTSQGLDSWRYHFGSGVAQVRDFRLKVRTNFKDIDFPENTLAPAEKHETTDGWELTWSYRNLVSGFQLGLAMPRKLQPGPLAAEISYFGPVSLFFFFFWMFIVTVLRNIELHPMNYFFLAGAFFSFHLLLAYLVDHISIHAAFVVCSAVSIFLVVSYLRVVVGMRFALVHAGLAQFLYLILFSYAFFLEGFTGLTVTIGAILTLFVVMQMTGRVRWAEKFMP